MNQYERIVSYIYQYVNGEKGINAGYAKIERRGGQCRISVQIRAAAAQENIKVYLFQQLSEGIWTIPAGQMIFRGNSMFWKGTSDADKLFQTEHGIDEIDGIFIAGSRQLYYATSWKNDSFYLGNWNQDGISASDDSEQETKLHQAERQMQSEQNLQQQSELQPKPNTQMLSEQQSELQPKPNTQMQSEQQSGENPQQQSEIQPQQEADIEVAEEIKSEIQMQSICGVCPFKRKVYDYGKKILMSFPSMKPFENGTAKACVRMELQDIGCLPIASWSLSGNRFLLHGYYCYRHLLFAQLEDERYVLGVPGIFSEKEQRNAHRFGFSDFRSIGNFGKQQGAFGYWLLELPKGSETRC